MNPIPNDLKTLLASNCRNYNLFARRSLTYQSAAADRVLMVEFRETVDTIATTLTMLGYEVSMEIAHIESDSWDANIITAVKVNNEIIFSEVIDNE